MKEIFTPTSSRKDSFKKDLALLWMFCLIAFTGYSQQSYTFTNAGATGSLGPTQLQVGLAYGFTSLANSVVATGGIQSFTIPASGLYLIDAAGASGGNVASPYNKLGGFGSRMQGEFLLSQGDVLKIVVGQQGISGAGTGGGGGGSYVVRNNLPLVVAGGGGGPSSDVNGVNAVTVTAGTVDNPASAVTLGGTNGNGGGACSGTSYNAGGGGGFNAGSAGNGVNATGGGYGGLSFLNGATGGSGGAPNGGTPSSDGGFGGGGGANAVTVGGGGGGGYSGGAGGMLGLFACANPNSNLRSGGGGGGSYNAGANQVNAAGTQTGHGRVIIKELCNISITPLGLNASNALCAGNSVTLTTNAVNNYSWSNGAGTSSIVVSPATTTTYSLGATSPSNCTAYASITIVVNSAIPSLTVVNTAFAGGICPTNTVTLTASGAITYTWAGGTLPVTNGVSFGPTAPADYTVTGQNGCGTSTAVTSVSVHPFPTVTPSASSSTLCAGSSLTLTATGNATNYIWSGGSAPSGNGTGFFPPASTTTYSVIGTSALSCTAMATIPVTVHATPVQAPVASPALICIGNSSTLTATGAISYTWMSSTQTVNTASFAVTPAGAGVTTYTVIKANSTCVDTKTINVTTNSLPSIFAIVNPPTVCALQPATLSIGGGISYTWTAPGTPNFTFTGASPVVYPQASSTYTAVAFDGTCISTTTVSVAANPNPTITSSASSPSICIGQQVTLQASGGNSYTWTAGTNTFNSNGATITDSPTTAIAYNVSGDNNFGCTASAQQIVLVHPNPPTNAASNKPLVCSGGPSTLTASGATSYTWDASAGGLVSPTVVVNPVSAVSAVFIYTVTGSFATGCQASKTVQVGVYVPTLSITGSTNACIGGQISLSAGGGNPNSYYWNTGTSTSSFPSITTTIAATAVFTVSATGNSLSVSGCPATRTVAVDVYPNPVITASAERSVICPKESVQLYAGGGVSYSWSNSMSGATITVSPLNQTNNYVVTGTDNNGCVSTGTVQVKLQNCTGISEMSYSDGGILVYPNPSNGMFTVESKLDMDLTLVNELGQSIRKMSLNIANDHKVTVKDLAQGIYFLKGEGEGRSVDHKIVVGD